MKLHFVRQIILVIHFFVIILLWGCLDVFFFDNKYELLLILSFWNIFIFSILLYFEFKESSDFHPFMWMLIASIQFVGFNGISTYNTIVNGEHIYFGIYDITNYLTKGALFVSLEHVLLYLGFIIADRNNDSIRITDKLFDTDADYGKWAIRFYIFVWIMRGIALFVPLSSIASILVNITTQGQMIVLLLCLFAYLKTQNRIYLRIHWFIAIIEMALVLSSGMKEVLIQNLIPYMIYIFIQYKNNHSIFNFRFLAKLAILGTFVIFFVFPYVSLYRQMNWTERRNVGAFEVLSEYVGYITGNSRYNDSEENRSVDYMMMRAGSIEQNTFPIMYADNNGIVPRYLYYTAIAFIPRIIWPEKPQIRLGLMMHSLAVGKSNWENTKTSGAAFSIGFIGACYFTLGLWYALLMPFLMGFLITKFWYFYKKRVGVNLLAIWGIFGILAVINKDFEAFSDGGLAFCVWNFIYCFFIKIWESNRRYL